MTITTNERALLRKINTAVANERLIPGRKLPLRPWVRLDHLPASSRDVLTGLLNTASATHVAPSLIRKGLIYRYRRTVRLTDAGWDAAAGGS
jgi:hypothetical protein